VLNRGRSNVDVTIFARQTAAVVLGLDVDVSGRSQMNVFVLDEVLDHGNSLKFRSLNLMVPRPGRSVTPVSVGTLSGSVAVTTASTPVIAVSSAGLIVGVIIAGAGGSRGGFNNRLGRILNVGGFQIACHRAHRDFGFVGRARLDQISQSVFQIKLHVGGISVGCHTGRQNLAVVLVGLRVRCLNVGISEVDRKLVGLRQKRRRAN